MFSDIAASYDLLNRLLSLGRDRRWRREAARSASKEVPSGAMVFDACCGTADMAIELSKAFPQARTVAADFSGEMLRLASIKIAKAGLSQKIDLVKADMTRLPFKAGTFSACTVAFGLRNLAEPPAGMRESLRVLVPGGVFAVLEFLAPENGAMKKLYRFYLTRILPSAGNAVSGSRAYGYLADSVLDFYDPKGLVELALSNGFARAGVEDLDFDIVKLLVCRKA